MRNKLPKKAVYIIIISVFLAGLLMIWKKSSFKLLSDFAGTVQSAFSSNVFYVKDTFSSLNYVFSAKTGIKKLTEKNIMLDLQNQELRAENEKFRKLLELDKTPEFRYKIRCSASVIGANTDGFIYYYMINKGSKDGVSEGDGVIAGGNVLGRVMTVSDNVSRVQLLTDTKSSISARDYRSRVVGILMGSGYLYCHLNYIPKEKDVMEGDVVVTSGMTEAFPAGIRVGEVIKVDKKVDDLSMRVMIRPFVDVFSVEEVIVLKKQKVKLN